MNIYPPSTDLHSKNWKLPLKTSSGKKCTYHSPRDPKKMPSNERSSPSGGRGTCPDHSRPSKGINQRAVTLQPRCFHSIFVWMRKSILPHPAWNAHNKETLGFLGTASFSQVDVALSWATSPHKRFLSNKKWLWKYHQLLLTAALSQFQAMLPFSCPSTSGHGTAYGNSIRSHQL